MPTADARLVHSSVCVVNHLFAARRCIVGPVIAARLRNMDAGASFLEVVLSMGTGGERRPSDEQGERQSCDHRFHFRSPSFRLALRRHFPFRKPHATSCMWSSSVWY